MSEEFLDAIAARQPEHEALVSVHQRRRYTYLELQRETNRLVSINPAYRSAEVEYALNKVGCRAQVAMARFKTSLTHGATIVYPNDGFEPLSVLQTVQDEKCTGLHGVPTMFIAELDHPRFAEFDLSTLRTGIMAGSPYTTEVMKRVVSDMNLSHITISYGMTETSPVSCQSSIDTPLDKRVSTVGLGQPHLEVKIIGPDSGEVVATGVSGEFCTRGYSVMHGYWDDPARTAESFDADGWMHTGDLATMDSEGYVNIVGRIKDLVIRGGENIYPREIEEFLYRHPKAQDVQVVGLPDKRYGEELCAWIVPRPGETLSEDGDRQDPEVQDLRRNEKPARAGRRQNRLNRLKKPASRHTKKYP
jgi:acyl-CoA synthetase (AMP-forming)/AMP-acid ligase II